MLNTWSPNLPVSERKPMHIRRGAQFFLQILPHGMSMIALFQRSWIWYWFENRREIRIKMYIPKKRGPISELDWKIWKYLNKSEYRLDALGIRVLYSSCMRRLLVTFLHSKYSLIYVFNSLVQISSLYMMTTLTGRKTKIVRNLLTKIEPFNIKKKSHVMSRSSSKNCSSIEQKLFEVSVRPSRDSSLFLVHLH